jgi:hypothetical protein
MARGAQANRANMLAALFQAERAKKRCHPVDFAERPSRLIGYDLERIRRKIAVPRLDFLKDANQSAILAGVFFHNP